VISAALASGAEREVDIQIIKMFHSSILKTKFLSTFTEDERFQGMTSIKERPLAIMVVWAHPDVSDADIELSQEMLWHLSATHFKRDN
jgi:hypothetical protein